MIFDVNLDSGKLFATLPSGDQTTGDQTGRHECLLTVCDNPTCLCRTIYLKFIAQKPAADQQKGDQLAGDQPAGDQQNGEDTAPSACVDLATNGVDAGFRRMASPQRSLSVPALCTTTQVCSHSTHSGWIWSVAMIASTPNACGF